MRKIKKVYNTTMTSIGFPQKFNQDIAHLTATFLTPIPKKMLDWIPHSYIDNNEHLFEILLTWVDDSILFLLENKITFNYLAHLFFNPNGIVFIECKINQLEHNNQIDLLTQN